MKKALIVIGAIFALLVVALLAAPFVIPVETYKSQLLAQVEKATGREARIEGDFRLSLLPRFEFTAGNVSLANAPGAKAPNMVSLDKLDVRIAVLPLLGGEMVIDSFVLQKPVINLEIDAQGRPNWQFAPPAAEAKPAETAEAPSADSGGFGLAGLQLGDVRLVDGRVSYSDARTGASYTADAINMTVKLPSLTSPMDADGSLVWNNEKIGLTLGIANPNAFLQGDSTELAASVSARPVKLGFKGQASGGTPVKASGALDLDVPSVRKLAAWLGQPLAAPGEGFGPLKIVGQLGVDGQKYRFSQASLKLDKIEATGDFLYDGSGRLPYVNARLDAGVLDLNPYLPPEAEAPGKAAEPAPGGKAQAEGWSEEPIDLSALGKANADAELSVGGLVVRKITIGKSRMKVALKNGRLVTELTEMALYDGKGRATLSADGSGKTPAVSARFDLAGLKALPALKDTIDLDRIDGMLATKLDVTTQGGSQRAMISALRGNGSVRFANGAIRGINLGAMVRNVSSAFLDPKAREQQKTDFAELSGTFTITNGIVRNDDLALLSPLLRVGGKGTVNLPKRTVDYRIEPKLAATTEGQGGKVEVAGVMVPVIVSGPWDSLSYRPDLEGAIKGLAKEPSKALEELRKLAPGGDKPGTTPEGGGSAPALPKAPDVLKDLFSR